MATVGALAALVGGRVVGDPDRRISDVADLESAGPDHLSFLSNKKYLDAFAKSRAGAVLVAEGLEVSSEATLIVCDNPYLALARIATELHPPLSFPAGAEVGSSVHPEAKVDPSATVRVGAIVEGGATVAARSIVGPGCYVGHGARIGNDCTMHPGAKVLAHCVLGNRVILQAGAVIGSDGFGYAPDDKGRRHKIPQVGCVQLEDDVEIGANTTIDRATFGVTRIGAASKIDNLVQIAHNVTTGEDCVIISQSGIAGSTRLGDRVIVGAQGGIAGHIEIVSDVMFGARAGVANNIRTPGIYSGTPSMPHKQWLKVAMAQKAVPEMRRRLRSLQTRLEKLNREIARR